MDELIHLDISRNANSMEDSSMVIGSTSSMKKHFENQFQNIFELSLPIKEVLMPLSFGGGLNNIDQIVSFVFRCGEKRGQYRCLESPNLIPNVPKIRLTICCRSIDCLKVGDDYEVS